MKFTLGFSSRDNPFQPHQGLEGCPTFNPLFSPLKMPIHCSFHFLQCFLLTITRKLSNKETLLVLSTHTKKKLNEGYTILALS